MKNILLLILFLFFAHVSHAQIILNPSSASALPVASTTTTGNTTYTVTAGRWAKYTCFALVNSNCTTYNGIPSMYDKQVTGELYAGDTIVTFTASTMNCTNANNFMGAVARIKGRDVFLHQVHISGAGTGTGSIQAACVITEYSL